MRTTLLAILATAILAVSARAQFEQRLSFLLDGNVHPELVDGHRVDTIARVGDLDGDGVPDFALSLHSDFLNPEGIIVVSGHDGGLVRRIDPPAPGQDIAFGRTIIGLPDVDGDGVDDLCLTAPLMGNGAVLVVSGLGGLIATLAPFAGSAPFFEIGRQLIDLGDVDGDGGSWFAYSVPDAYGPDPGNPSNFLVDVGAVHVMKASVGAGITTVAILRGSVAGQKFGSSIGSLGDLDGDGMEDIAVASVLPQSFGSATFAYPTGHILLDIATGNPIRGEQGLAIAKLDDVDGDGFDDHRRDDMIVSGFDGSALHAAGLGRFATCGDIDGDGVTDFGVASSFRSGGDGGILVGASDRPLAGRGDHDGDGFDDAAFVTVTFVPAPIPFDPPVPLHRIEIVSACGAKRYGENLGGLQSLDLDWVAGGQSDPAIGALEVNGAVPGALGLMAVSLAPASYDYLGLQILVDPDPLNVVYQGGFGFGFLGESSAAANIRSPWVAGTSFHFQAFQTWPTLATSNGLELRFVP